METPYMLDVPEGRYPILMPKPTAGRETWELMEPWGLRIPRQPTRRALYLTPGFTTDGASIPRFAWPLVGHPFMIGAIRGAVAHDALYCHHGLDRSAADAALRDVIIADAKALATGKHKGVNSSYTLYRAARLARAIGKAYAMWAAVRLFGHRAWNDPARVIISNHVSLPRIRK